MSEAAKCRVCPSGQAGDWFQVREMLFGSRESFQYFRCQSCGCLQIAEVPPDLSVHYPPSYFSFQPQHRLASSRWRPGIDRRRVARAYGEPSLIGTLADAVSKPLDYLGWAGPEGFDRNNGVLDVGCGAGKLLLRMRHGGFARCVGIDPFIENPIEYRNGVRIHRENIETFAGRSEHRFGVIVFNHSLEHLPDQLSALSAARKLLLDSGTIVVRVPVSDGLAFATYRENWVHLDAPRHIFLHTTASLEALAARLDLTVSRVVYDSTRSQFTGSELYRRDIPMNAPKQQKAVFSRGELRQFEARARKLNAEGRGDTAMFLLAPRRATKSSS